MRINMGILILLAFCCVSCDAQKIRDAELISLLQQYREAKSTGYALSGDKWGGNEVKRYWHKDFYTMANDFKPAVYVLSNDYGFQNIEVESNKNYVAEYGKNNTYVVNGAETVIGQVVDNQIQYFSQPNKVLAPYVFILSKGEPLVYMDGMFRAYYVLEKDVPLLLDRLKKTGAQY